MYLGSLRPQITFFSQLLMAISLLWLLLSHSASAADQAININTASPATLAEQLPGIGPAKALAIVVYREEFGLFETLEQLIEVKGIGPSTLENIRPCIYIDTGDLLLSTSTSVVEDVPLVGKTQAEHQQAAREAVRAAMKNALLYRSGDLP